MLETGFEADFGNYIIIGLQNDITVTYGHLKDWEVKNGEYVSRGQVIGTLGQSGMAAGPNLALKVLQEGEPVNPFLE